MGLQDYEDWIRRVYSDYAFTILNDTPESYDGAAGYIVVVNDTETGLDYFSFNLDDHSARHEEGGADELTGITGKLNAHSARHEEGGADELTGITGKLNAHSARHENGGADEMSVAGLSGELADDQPPKSHASSHKDGGADELDAADLSGAAGTSGQVLTTDGAAASWGSVGGGTGYFGILPTGVTNQINSTNTGYTTLAEWQIYVSSDFVLGVRVRAKTYSGSLLGYYRIYSPTAGVGGANSFTDTSWAWRAEVTLDCSGLSEGWHTFRLQLKVETSDNVIYIEGMTIRMV